MFWAPITELLSIVILPLQSQSWLSLSSLGCAVLTINICWLLAVLNYSSDKVVDLAVSSLG